MSDFSSPALVAQVENLILLTFDVSRDEAHDYASGLAALAEGWGSQEKAAGLDWAYRVKQDLGGKLRWRSNAERQTFRQEQEQRYKAYDVLIHKPGRA